MSLADCSSNDISTQELEALTLACRHARESLTAFLGQEEADTYWRRVLERACVGTQSACHPECVQRIADALREIPGPPAIVGASLAIHVRSYRLLSSANKLETYFEGEAS
ncbi:MAG: hypothetical protein AAGD01_11585 [Acidobacteriota bacterium]